ncbi:MAG: hypothetical protein AAFW98_15640, partial [Pseudomonadota bacterium]
LGEGGVGPDRLANRVHKIHLRRAEQLEKGYPGYVEMHDVSAPGASIKFTPQPLFFDLTTEWASMLQQMVAKQVSVDEGLDQLAASVDRQLKDAGLG